MSLPRILGGKKQWISADLKRNNKKYLSLLGYHKDKNS